MKKKRNQSPDTSALRQQAEVRLNTSKSENASTSQFVGDTQRILYELEVHQIELEMQNEELRRTRAELEASQARYFDLFDLAPVGFVILNETGLILETNLAETDLLGVARNALVNLPLTHFILPEDQDIYYHLRKRLFDTRTPQVCELRMLRANVSPFWAEMRVTTGQDANGMLVCRAVMIDITERKQAEKALRESEEGYRTLFENSITGISQALPDGRLIRANTAYAHMYGYANPEEMLAEVTNIGRLYANPADREEVLRVLANKGILEPKEMAVIRRDGTRFYVLVGARVIRDSAGSLRCYQAVHVDITERKRAEEALRKSQQLLEKTFTSLLDAIFIIDAGTTEIIDCNPASSRIFGYSRQEMLGRTTAFLNVDQASLEEFRQYLDPGVAEKGFLFLPEFRMKRKDGTVFPTEHSVVPLENEQGKHIGWVSVVRDITERVRAENELTQSHEQLHALTAYWQATVEAERAYIAREIHDQFGQSMTALKMDLTWLAKRLPEGDERVERIRGMNTLVDESIALMRRIATELRPNLLDDLGLSAALEWQAREFSGHSGISCKLNLPRQDLNLDPALSTTLFRIFQESLTNVARHAQATRIHATLQKKNQTVILTIRDNGRGITQSELEAPRSLGLLGLRERAAQWGGKTTIGGAAGKGTTVTVSIPLPTKTTTGGDR